MLRPYLVKKGYSVQLFLIIIIVTIYEYLTNLRCKVGLAFY